MAKAPKLEDVKRPDKVIPSATARPIIVTNHGGGMMTKDPMMAPTTSDAEQKEETPATGLPMTHAKVIAPITPITVESPDEEDTGATEEKEKKENKEATESTQPETKPEVAEESSPESAAPKSADIEPTPERPAAETKDEPSEAHNSDADITAEEAAAAEAKVKRDQEIEGIITSGKYTVPIDAVQRHRSHVATALLCAVAILLAVVLLDAVADVGIVHVPAAVPHTHFFSKN